MGTLHLVRHGRPARDPAVAPALWSLAPGAGDDVERLRGAGVLPTDAVWVSSSEPKAVATARLLTPSLQLDDGLREAARTSEWLAEAHFEHAVRQSFAAPTTAARPGWEPLAQTRRRVVRTAHLVLARSGDRDVVLVGHGTAWTLLVAALTGAPPDVEVWTSMPMPDHCALDRRGTDGPSSPTAGTATTPRAEWRISKPWGSWTA